MAFTRKELQDFIETNITASQAERWCGGWVGAYINLDETLPKYSKERLQKIAKRIIGGKK